MQNRLAGTLAVEARQDVLDMPTATALPAGHGALNRRFVPDIPQMTQNLFLEKAIVLSPDGVGRTRGIEVLEDCLRGDGGKRAVDRGLLGCRGTGSNCR